MNKIQEKILILSTDFLTINLAWILYFGLRVESGWFSLIITPEFLIPMLVVYFYWLIIFTFVGMYRTWFASSRFDELSTLFKASFVGIFILFSLIFLDDYLNKVSSPNRILIFIYWGMFLLLVGSGRLFVRSFQRKLLINGIGRKNVLIVGFNQKAKDVHDQLIQHRALGLDVKGYVSSNGYNQGDSYKEIKIIGSVNNIENLIDEFSVQEIIIALEKDDHDLLIQLISKCDQKNVGIKIVPDLYEVLSGQAKTSQIYGLPLIDIMPELMPEWEKKLKRTFDIIISLLVIIFTFPICFIISIAIKIDSKGPVFFTQERCGQNGKTFTMIKFRSMVRDAEKISGPVWSQKDDPRITDIGRLIR
ncbi:MAG TPA: sugar transferase, partial [Ignavibacteriaceae bacterium]|nr:sugar transferase [Ignavibacteriaceae bacterium]